VRTDTRGRVHIVGVGPGGDPSHLTEAARQVLTRARLAIYPGTQLGPPLRAAVAGELRWGRWFDEQQIRGWVIEATDRGQDVALLSSGDPTLYSGQPGRFGSLSTRTAWLREVGLDFEIHPGVSSLQVLLGRLGLEHAEAGSGLPMAVYAPGRDPSDTARARLSSLASLGVPLALFLADQFLDEILEIGTRCFGASGRVIVGHHVGWPDEWLIDTTLGALPERLGPDGLPRHTIVLLGSWHG